MSSVCVSSLHVLQQLMPVFVLLICTHINQIKFHADSNLRLQHPITSEKSWFLFPRLFVFSWKHLFWSYHLLFRLLQEQLCSHKRKLLKHLKPAFGNMALYKCWNYSVGNHVLRKHIQWAMRSTHGRTWAGNFLRAPGIHHQGEGV